MDEQDIEYKKRSSVSINKRRIPISVRGKSKKIAFLDNSQTEHEEKVRTAGWTVYRLESLEVSEIYEEAIGALEA